MKTIIKKIECTQCLYSEMFGAMKINDYKFPLCRECGGTMRPAELIGIMHE